MLTVVLLISGSLVILTVAIHLSLLRLLSHLIHHMRRMPVIGMGVSMAAAIAVHILEIWIFSLVLMYMSLDGRFGSLTGDLEQTARDYFYVSALAYTSLGFGDIAPHGTLRALAAVEAITGLVLIAWTASFAFLAMTELWRDQLPKH